MEEVRRDFVMGGAFPHFNHFVLDTLPLFKVIERGLPMSHDPYSLRDHPKLPGLNTGLSQRLSDAPLYLRFKANGREVCGFRSFQLAGHYVASTVLLDLYQGVVKTNSHYRGKISPAAWWKKSANRERAWAGFASSARWSGEPGRREVLSNFRTFLRTLWKVEAPEVSVFPPALAVALVRYLCPQPERAQILDCYACWGERLVAAACIGCFYLGFADSPQLMAGLEGIARDFGRRARHLVMPWPLIRTMFAWTCDIAFVCPTRHGSQIVRGGTTAQPQAWNEDYVSTLEKTWRHLKLGGYLCATVHNCAEFRTADLTIEVMAGLEGAVFLGCLGATKPRRMIKDKPAVSVITVLVWQRRQTARNSPEASVPATRGK